MKAVVTQFPPRFEHSKHSQRRASQRGIDNECIHLAMNYGEVFQKQGLYFIVAKEKNFPDHIPHELVEKARHLVVVVNADQNEVVTCYRNPKGIRYINKKAKSLCLSFSS